MTKWRHCIVVLFFCLGMIGIFHVVHADSGWDFSYDSGDSWDSGSSWEDDSSWSSSSGGGIYYIGSGSLGSAGTWVTIFAVVMVTIIVAYSIRGIRTRTGHASTKKHYLGLTEEQIKEKDATLNKEELQSKVFHIYKEVQVAWMNFDYDKLRTYLTDELYHMYESQLKTLKIKNQKNVMKDIVLKDVKILDIDIENGIEEVRVYLNVSQYDYVVDKENKIVRGTETYKNNVDYIITFVRYMDGQKVDECPNCGAPIDIISGGTCPYCDSEIVNRTNEFIMSKKECVGQWRER